MHEWKKLKTLSADQLRDLQDKKLHHFINHQVYPFSPHYRKLFDDYKIKPGTIKKAQDLQKIPFASKSDFIGTPQDPEKFRGFVLQPDQEKIRRFSSKLKLLELAFLSSVKGKEYILDKLSQEYQPIFLTFTTGTTNTPVPFLYTDYDIKNLYTSGGRMLNLFDMKSDERGVSFFPFAPHLAFWQVAFGGLSSRRTILSTGGGKVMSSEANIGALRKMKPSVIFGVPSYVYHVLRLAQEKGEDLSFINKIVLGAARVTEAFKVRLAGLLTSMGAHNVSVFGTYGFTEARCAWVECPAGLGISSGYHLYPDKEILEIIDPKTGEVKKEGEDGELVYTSIDSRGSVVLRYRTGDFVKGGITLAPCPYCKSTVPRLSSDITRMSDVKDLQLSKIKGTLVDLNCLMQVLSDIDAVTEWQIEIRKKDNDPFDVDELVIYVCPKGGFDKNALTDLVKNKVAMATEVTPNQIVFCSLPEIVKRLELETSSKEKRIIDARPK